MNPLVNFQELHGDSMGELRDALEKPAIKTALIFGLSILADSGASKDEIHGASMFITTLERMSQPPLKMPEFPDKSTLKSYEKPLSK